MKPVRGFTLLEVVLAIALATMAVGILVTVFGATTVGARIAQQAEASSQVMALIEEELEQGNPLLVSGGTWDYGELPGVIPVSRQDLNRYRLDIERQGVESFAGGGEVVRYGILLCSMPVGADQESCSQTVFQAPPPAVAPGAGVTTDTASQLFIGGEDPTGGALVVATNGTATQTYTSYGTYSLSAGYTVTGSPVVNASGIRYQPEVASGGGAVQVYYKADSGAIIINVTKEEPALNLPALSLTGPGGFSAAVPEGESRYAEAEAGTYRMEAQPASYGGYDYAARYGSTANADGSFEVRTGAVKRVDVHYTATNGKIRLEFKGGGPAPRLELKKKAGADYTPIDTFTLSTAKSYERMDPTTYAVALAGAYRSDGISYGLEFRRYDPAAATWTPWFKEDEARFDLIPGRETIVWMRAYPTTGKLTLNLGGPPDVRFTLTVAGTNLDGTLYKREFDRPGTYTLDDLAPGTYSIQASSGQDSSGNYYLVQGPEAFTIGAGQNQEVTVDYAQAQEGTLVVFSVSTSQGPRWENEPTAYKTAVVEATATSIPPDAWSVHRSFQPFLIPPGKDGWICIDDPIPGQYVTYEVADFLDQLSSQWVDCLRFHGQEGELQIRRAIADVRATSTFFSTQVNVIRDAAPAANFYARFRIEQDTDGGYVVRIPAEVKGNELAVDPNAAGHWLGSAEEQIGGVNAVIGAYGVARYPDNPCDLWSLDVSVFDPGGAVSRDSGTFSRDEAATLPIANHALNGKKVYLNVYARCP